MMFRGSASQVDSFERCIRRWGFAKIDKLRSPPGPGAVLGTKTHRQSERWLKTCTLPDTKKPEGKLATALIPYLPPPQSIDKANVEIKQRIVLEKRFVTTLVVDLWVPEKPAIYDHKTTSDFKWAIKPHELHQKVQPALYADWGLKKSGAKKIWLHWNYVRTRGARKVLPVVAQVSAADIRQRMDQTISSFEKMEEYSKAKSALELPYNPAACEDFGGCPFKDRCNLTAKERMLGIMAKAASGGGWKDRVKKQATKVNPPEEADVEETEEDEEEEEEEEETPPPKKKASKKKAKKKVAPPPSDDDEEEEEEEEEAPPPKKGSRLKKETPPPDDDEEEEEEEAPPPKKRGRPKGSKTKKTLMLFVNCNPVKGVDSFVYGADLIQEVLDLLREETELAHYRLIEFGQGQAQFQEAMRKYLEANPPSVPVVLQTSTPEARDCLQAFLSAADLVIFG